MASSANDETFLFFAWNCVRRIGNSGPASTFFTEVMPAANIETGPSRALGRT